MSRIRISTELVQTINFFEQLTRSRVKDCVETSDTLYFIVEEGEIGRALGKGASNVKQAQEKLGRRIRIAEYSPVLAKLLENLLHPVTGAKIEEKGEIVVIHAPNTQARGLIIGRGGSNLRSIETVVKRYFPAVKEIKVPSV